MDLSWYTRSVVKQIFPGRAERKHLLREMKIRSEHYFDG